MTLESWSKYADMVSAYVEEQGTGNLVETARLWHERGASYAADPNTSADTWSRWLEAGKIIAEGAHSIATAESEWQWENIVLTSEGVATDLKAVGSTIVSAASTTSNILKLALIAAMAWAVVILAEEIT